MEAKQQVLAWWAVGVFLVAATAVTVHQPYAYGPAIRSDGLGYHAWTRAILDGHVSFCEYLDLKDVQAIRRPRPQTGRCPNKYAPGLALLRFPVMAPFTAANGGVLRSGAEDVVNQAWGIVMGAVAVGAMVVASRTLGARRWVANTAALSLAFGTGLFHYATIDSAFTHVTSAAFVAVMLLYGAVRLFGNDDRRDASTRSLIAETALVAAVSAAFVAIRLPSFLVLAALVVAAMYVVHRRRLGWRVGAPILAGSAIGVGAVTVGQLAYNRFNFGIWTLSSYGDERLIPGQLKQLDVLASIEKGFVTWYPVVIVVVLAVVLARSWPALALLAGVTLPLVVLYGAWASWSLAGGFGHRGFVEIVPVYGVVFACALERLTRDLRTAVLLVAGLAVVMTMGLMAAYWNYDIGFYGIDGARWIRHAVGGDSFPVVVYRWFADVA